MKYFLIIFIIGFLWITRDIIRVPETFNDSWFKQFAGNQFIDPQVSWTNQYVLGDIFSPILSTVSDLFHLLGTTILFLFFLVLLKAYRQKWTFSNLFGNFEIILFLFICFGAGVFTGQGLFRNLLN
jgi:hypothetical protein